jgi:hypothetical protein
MREVVMSEFQRVHKADIRQAIQENIPGLAGWPAIATASRSRRAAVTQQRQAARAVRQAVWWSRSASPT